LRPDSCLQNVFKASVSVRVVCVAYDNVTTCTPNATACCASRKITKNKRLCSMMSKFACSNASVPSSENTILRFTTPESG